ncbi:MAG: Hsp70 family protein, partial [Phormidium sp.]
GTGREQSIRITNTGGLTAAEVERMRQEAEIFAEEDRRRKQLIEMKNQADSLFYSYESTMKDNSQFVSEEMQAYAQERAAELRGAIADSYISLEEMKQLVDSFQQMLFEIGAAVYQQANVGQTDFVDSYSPGDPEPVDDATTIASEDEDFDFNFEDENTVSADYEAVD